MNPNLVRKLQILWKAALLLLATIPGSSAIAKGSTLIPVNLSCPLLKMPLLGALGSMAVL